MIEIGTFVSAGNANFTITSKKTGTHYTYHITKKGNRWFVRIQTTYGESVYAGYLTNYLGKWVFYKGQNGNCSADDTRVLALMWTLYHCDDIDFTDKIKFQHLGKCCKCGRPLTNPESIDLGIGPECSKMIL